MMRRFLTALAVILATGCGSSPTSPESTPPTVTVSGAAATAPAPGTVIPYASQPVTLLATLPVATPAAPLTSFVGVATGAAFLSTWEPTLGGSSNGTSSVSYNVRWKLHFR
jgi:hypothetical protein